MSPLDSMTPRIAIIGAGLSGLSAARHLNANLPCDLQILEKSRSVSGRCATNTHLTSTPLDHGAPFFTLSQPLQTLVPLPSLDTLPADAIQTPTLQPIPQPQPLHYLPAGNAHLARYIFPDAPIHRATVTAVHPNATLDILPQHKQTFHTVGPFDAIICTAPLPQAAKILNAPPQIAHKWNMAYKPTLTTILEYDLSLTPPRSPLHLSAASQPPYAIRSDLVFSLCESFKRRNTSNRAVIVAHANDSFSRRFVDEDAEQWLATIRSEVERVWQIPEEARVDGFAKRWRYARVKKGSQENGAWMACDWLGGRVFIPGDGLGDGGEVERSISNGLKVAEEIVKQIKG
eukprot:GFKZ01002000.1.p1 GENE.GFKZ01002000.1~~GFKZ01002000.1.p1  ORF type:complete len:364 (-),score=42.39 GFKZ01002000.1:675-1709(-)